MLPKPTTKHITAEPVKAAEPTDPGEALYPAAEGWRLVSKAGMPYGYFHPTHGLKDLPNGASWLTPSPNPLKEALKRSTVVLEAAEHQAAAEALYIACADRCQAARDEVSAVEQRMSRARRVSVPGDVNSYRLIDELTGQAVDGKALTSAHIAAKAGVVAADEALKTTGEVLLKARIRHQEAIGREVHRLTAIRMAETGRVD